MSGFPRFPRSIDKMRAAGAREPEHLVRAVLRTGVEQVRSAPLLATAVVDIEAVLWVEEIARLLTVHEMEHGVPVAAELLALLDA